MYEELQQFIDEAGFHDLNLADTPRRGDKVEKIVSIAGTQLAKFPEPTFGETLMYSVISDATSRVSLAWTALRTDLVHYMMEASPEYCSNMTQA